MQRGEERNRRWNSLLISIELVDVGGQRRKVLMVYQKLLLRESACYLLQASRKNLHPGRGKVPTSAHPSSE